MKTPFDQKGYQIVPSLLSEDELASLELLYNKAMKQYIENVQSKHDQGLLNYSTIWIFKPETLVPELLESSGLERVKHFAEELLGAPILNCSYRIFHKPPTIGSITPWHQDEAYKSPDLIHNALNVWIPLDDVGIEEGCLKYISGPIDQPIVEHRGIFDQASKGLVIEAISPPDNEAINICLNQGDVSFHHCRTLHSSNSNSSSKPRRALVMVCEGESKKNPTPDKRPWLELYKMFKS